MSRSDRIVNQAGPATSSTVAKAIRVLDALVASDRPLGLSELARRVALDKATTLRLVGSLVAADLVVSDAADRRYRPGLRLVRMADTVLARRSFATLVQGHLERLSSDVGEAAVAGVLEGGEMVNVAHVVGTGELRVGRSVGERWPVHVSASGKAILANLSPEERRAALQRCSFERFTPATIVDRGAFERALEPVRHRGWADMVEERSPGVSSIGAPVFDRLGRVVGALGIVGWSARVDRAFIEQHAGRVVAAATNLSTELGWTDPSRAMQSTGG